MRTRSATVLRRAVERGIEQRFGLAEGGALGFITHACIKTNDGPLFRPFYLCRDLIEFLIFAASYHRKHQYYGGYGLSVVLKITSEAKLLRGIFGPKDVNPGSDIFEPPLESIKRNDYVTDIPLALHPVTSERLLGYIEAVLNDLARVAGCVLGPKFRAAIKPVVDEAVKNS